MEMTLAEIPEQTMKTIRSGELVIDLQSHKGRHSLKMDALIKAKPENTWGVIADPANYTETMPRISESTVLSQDGNIDRVRIVLSTPFPLPNLSSVMEGVHTERPGEYWSRSWRQVEGAYKFQEGAWILLPLSDDETYLRYQFDVELKFRVPAKIVSWAQKRVLPQLVAQITEHANKRSL